MLLSPEATENLKVEKPTELHSVVLHLAPVTRPHCFPTECTEEEALVRTANDIRILLPMLHTRNRNM